MSNMEDNKKKDIYSVAAAKLSRRSLSVKELGKYLKEKGYSSEEIESLTEEFLSLGYLNDAAYSEAFFRYGDRKGWSNARIKKELFLRGVSEEDIEEGQAAREREAGGFFDSVESSREDNSKSEDWNRAFGVASKMIGAGDLDSRGRLEEKVKGRVARRLYGYGYGSSLIFDVIKAVEESLRDE